MGIPAVGVAIAAALALSCGGATAFACDDPTDCAAGADVGTCEASGYCSFPDLECASGRRYGSHATRELAGTCVPPDVADDGTAGTTIDDGEVGDANGESSITEPGGTTFALDGSGSSAAAESTSGSVDTSSGSTSVGESSTTSSGAFEVEYEAVIAVCTEDTVFDPVQCAVEAGVDQITLDAQDNGMLVCNVWLRFDLDDALAGAELISAELTATVGPDADDDSQSSGELWTTQPFDLVSLTVANPAAIEMIGADQGAIRIGAEITWSIPIELVVVGESMHLALVPVTTDGLDLWGDSSELPPRLVVTAM